jgi:hypothetical protein
MEMGKDKLAMSQKSNKRRAVCCQNVWFFTGIGDIGLWDKKGQASNILFEYWCIDD